MPKEPNKMTEPNKATLNPTKRRRKSTQATRQGVRAQQTLEKIQQSDKTRQSAERTQQSDEKTHWKMRQDQQVKAIEPGFRIEQENTKGQNRTSRSWRDKSYQNKLEVAAKSSNPTMLLQHLTDENKLKEFQLMISPFLVIFFSISDTELIVLQCWLSIF